MSKLIANVSNPKNSKMLLIGCVFLGILVGIQTSAWQYAIENAQHILGLIRLPPES